LPSKSPTIPDLALERFLRELRPFFAGEPMIVRASYQRSRRRPYIGSASALGRRVERFFFSSCYLKQSVLSNLRIQRFPRDFQSRRGPRLVAITPFNGAADEIAFQRGKGAGVRYRRPSSLFDSLR
jgi:hypothetical protein